MQIIDKTTIQEITILRLDRGEDLFITIRDYLKENKIHSGYITAIGALQEYTLGYFDGNEYQKIIAKDPVELLSCLGNISLVEGVPFPHIHAIVGRIDGSTCGGHVMEGCIVNFTGEVIIYAFQGEIKRKFNDAVKLNLLNV